MLKPLTFSLSLAVALGTCSLGLAGHFGGYASGQYPTAQGQMPSAQAVYPSAQDYCDTGYEVPCEPTKRHRLCDLFKKREKCYTYEWVLKKKRCGGLFGHKRGGDCGPVVEDCVGCEVIPSAQYPSAQYPSAQVPSGQAVYSAPQSYAAPQGQTFGAPQYSTYGAGDFAPANGDAAPAAPNGESVPAAPEAAPPDSASPAGEEPQANNSSLLFLAPAGN